VTCLAIVNTERCDESSIRVLEHRQGGIAIHTLDHHEPVDGIAVGAAAITMKVVGIDVQGGRAISMKRAIDIAVGCQRLAD
jgi:hypothetical protein